VRSFLTAAASAVARTSHASAASKIARLIELSGCQKGGCSCSHQRGTRPPSCFRPAPTPVEQNLMSSFDGTLPLRRYIMRMVAALTLITMTLSFVSAPLKADPPDMKVWIGKYPFTDIVRGSSFLESPEVKTRIAETLGPGAFAQIQIMASAGPIEQRVDWLIASACVAAIG
jgi:hypothetical protein